MAAHDTEPLPVAPYSPDLLADLHADALSESVSSRLWPLVRGDADAMAVIDALDALTARLGTIGEDSEHGMPVPPVVVERIDRALAEQAGNSADAASAPVVQLRSHRSRGVFIATGIAAAILLIAAVSAVVVPQLRSSANSESVVAEPSLVFPSNQVDSGVALSIIGRRDAGPLSDPTLLSECLQANGIGPSTPILGSSEVTVGERDGTLLVIPGPTPPQLVALAVGDRCGAGDADTLARRGLN